MSPAAITTNAPQPSGSTKTSIMSSAKAIIAPSTIASKSRSVDVPPWVKPDLKRLLRVEHLEGDFAARSISLVSLPAGATFARITTPTPATCAYSSVQASRDLHIELNCDLVYINHSCQPTLIFDMVNWEVRVNPNLKAGLNEGDELTFFYPSTEWDMAQPFECQCKEKGCNGTITGAKDMDVGILKEYWLSAHITELLEEKAQNRLSK